MNDLGAALREATVRLREAGVASPRRDAVLLAAHGMGVTPGEVERAALLGADVPKAFEGLVAQRSRRVPLQHLTGSAPFRRLDLRVGPGVFVPRPETELVVDVGLAELARLGARSGSAAADVAADVAKIDRGAGEAVAGVAPVVVDLGSGSGAIALAVKDEAPHARVVGVEVSELALAWAEDNRDRSGLQVDFVLGDAGTVDLAEAGAPDGCVDIVLSNPPYIPPGAAPTEPEVGDHDPELALYGGGSDGLDVPRALAARAAGLLRPGGLLVMEHADVQGGRLIELLRRDGEWTEVQDHDDLARRPRVVTARLAGAGLRARRE